MRNVTRHGEIDQLRQDLADLLDKHRPDLRADAFLLEIAMWEYEQSLLAPEVLQAA